MLKTDCRVLHKIKKERKLKPGDFHLITSIAREQIKFMVRNNIPLIPDNYALLFTIFCHIVENNLRLSDPEIIGLFKERYPTTKDIEAVIVEFAGEEKEAIAHIAESINRELAEILSSLSKHKKQLAEKQKDMKEAGEKLSDEYTKQVLTHIVNQLEEIMEQNDTLKVKLEESKKQIEELRQELREAEERASIDFLTRIANRASFSRAMADMFKDFNERNYPFSMLLIDIDDFKNINDSFGHQAGDKVLKEIAREIKSLLRARDVVARLGGDEFAVLLPGSIFGQAIRVAERLRKKLSEVRITHKGKEIPVSVSIGVAVARKGMDESIMMEVADKALYLAKRSGKNQIKTDLDLELESE